MKNFLVALSLFAAAVAPAAAQDTFKDSALRHLKTSRDFTLQVAEAMPEADYSFKLTQEQMSFGQQMTHLSTGLSYFMSPFTGQKPDTSKPASMSKADVKAFITKSYDDAIAIVEKLTPEQLAKKYPSEEGTESGYGLVLGALDHCTHHRASAEMYLRAKGIKPPDYKV